MADRIVQLKDKAGDNIYPIAGNPAAPVASSTTLGMVKVGTSMKIDANSNLNVNENGVTTGKIADGAVTAAKLANGILDSKVDVASIDLTSKTTTLLSLTKALGTNGKNYARWISKTDGGSSGISDKPTGSTNASFVCEAECSRWATSSDYTYQLTCWVQTYTNPYVAVVTPSTTSLSWTKLVAADKLADKSITTAKIADSAVTNVKIANTTIGSEKLNATFTTTDPGKNSTLAAGKMVFVYEN